PSKDYVVPFTHKSPTCARRKTDPVVNPYPLSSRQVWSRNNVGTLCELGEILRRGFERQTHGSRLQRRQSEHLAADFEEQVVAPLDLFRHAWKRKANLTQPIDIHGQDSRTKRVPASMNEMAG